MWSRRFKGAARQQQSSVPSPHESSPAIPIQTHPKCPTEKIRKAALPCAVAARHSESSAPAAPDMTQADSKSTVPGPAEQITLHCPPYWKTHQHRLQVETVPCLDPEALPRHGLEGGKEGRLKGKPLPAQCLYPGHQGTPQPAQTQNPWTEQQNSPHRNNSSHAGGHQLLHDSRGDTVPVALPSHSAQRFQRFSPLETAQQQPWVDPRASEHLGVEQGVVQQPGSETGWSRDSGASL